MSGASMKISPSDLWEPKLITRPAWKKSVIEYPKDAVITTIVHEPPEPPKPKPQPRAKTKPKYHRRKTTNMTGKKYSTWTEKENQLLIKLYYENATYAEISDAVHHSEKCIGAKVQELRKKGLIVGMRNTTGWTEEQKKKLVSMRKQGKTFDEIKKAIGKSRSAAWTMYQKLESEGWIS